MLPIAPPTDNLYKFLAIAGLAAAVIALVMPHRERDEIERELSVLQAEAALAEHDAVRLNDRISSLDAKSTIPATGPTSARLGDVRDEAAQLQRLRDDLQETNRELQVKTARIRALHEIARSHGRSFRSLVWTGLGLAGLGFTLWYVKVQKVQDRLLALQLVKASAESIPTPACPPPAAPPRTQTPP